MKTKIFNSVTLKPKCKFLLLTTFVRRSLGVGVFYLLLTTYLFSQAPQGFNYQAVARDGDNNVLANTGLDVKIGLLQGGENGTLIWEEIHTVTTNELGLFTLTIGDSTATIGTGSVVSFSDIDWTTGSYYMKVQVDDREGGGYVDMGTTELQSVPYSLFAESGNEGPQGPEGPRGPQGEPGDPATDDQTLSVDGHDLTISEGNTVTLPDSVIDDDADTLNEIQDLQLTGNDLSITNNASATNIDLSPYLDNTDNWSVNGDSIYYMGSVGIGTSTPLSKMAVQGDDVASEEPLFEVKRKDGQTVFAVYNEGVRVFVDTSSAKGPKGGFAVGGFSASKGISQDYMRITPDSVRVYVDKESTKGPKGGFAVGGFSASKASSQEFLRVTPDSVRVYIDETISKGPKGGFAVGGYSSSKGTRDDFLRVSNDSTRIYTTSTGGFSVGQIGTETEKYMSLTKENYFIGHQSGINTKPVLFSGDGIYNSFIGYESGKLNTLGSNNVFLGYQSGYSNEFAKNNIFIGNKAGYTTEGIEGDDYSGCHNVFIGYLSGWLNTVGQSNVFVGKQSGFKNDSGRYNTYIGQNCGVQNDDGNFNTFIGAKAGEHNTDGSNNVYIGYSAGGQNTTESDLLFIDNSNTESPLIYGNFSNGAEEVLINGNFDATGTIGGPSDIKFKRNIEPLSNVLDKLKLINGIYFDWRKEKYPEMVFNNGRQIGIVAQEIEKIFPELVRTTSKNYKTVDYSKISAILIEAVKEQQATINKMQKQIETLRSTIDSIKKE